MTRPHRVLLVDDDPRLRDALLRTLHGPFEIVAVASADEGKRALLTQDPFAVVLSDLHAAEQHELIVAQRELLEGTLHGCVDALADVRAIANPLAFARAQRVRDMVGAFTDRFDVGDRWKFEVAAILSQLGAASLPHDLAEKAYFGRELTPNEEELVGRLPAYAASVIAPVPRLGVVREIVAQMDAEPDSTADTVDDFVRIGARLLRIVFDFDVLITQGHSTHLALEVMTTRVGVYDPDVLEDFGRWQGEVTLAQHTRSIHVGELAVGVMLATDIVDDHGVLLVAHGQRVSPRALDLVRSYFGPECHTRTVLIRVDEPENAAAPNDRRLDAA